MLAGSTLHGFAHELCRRSKPFGIALQPSLLQAGHAPRMGARHPPADGGQQHGLEWPTAAKVGEIKHVHGEFVAKTVLTAMRQQLAACRVAFVAGACQHQNRLAQRLQLRQRRREILSLPNDVQNHIYPCWIFQRLEKVVGPRGSRQRLPPQLIAARTVHQADRAGRCKPSHRCGSLLQHARQRRVIVSPVRDNTETNPRWKKVVDNALKVRVF